MTLLAAEVNYNYVAGQVQRNADRRHRTNQERERHDGPAKGLPPWLLLNRIHSSDTLTFTASGFSPSNGKSQQHYKSLDLQGTCYDKFIKSLNYAITSTVTRC